MFALVRRAVVMHLGSRRVPVDVRECRHFQVAWLPDQVLVGAHHILQLVDRLSGESVSFGEHFLLPAVPDVPARHSVVHHIYVLVVLSDAHRLR